MTKTYRDKTVEDFRVNGLEDVQPAYAEFDGDMYAGLLPSNNGNRTGETMFWLFEPTTQDVPDTIVLWLNGGPGCSSFNCGVMMENVSRFYNDEVTVLCFPFLSYSLALYRFTFAVTRHSATPCRWILLP